MAFYAITGKLGSGKSKFAVKRMQEYLLEGRRVATNLDIKVEHLVPHTCRGTIIRLPDKPTAADLEALPHGNPDSYDEERNGGIFLDELGSWLNARTYQDKDRQNVVDWLLHSRKHGWDTFCIVQGVGMIDRQVRENLLEYTVRCRKYDKVRVPVVGGLLHAMFGGRVGYWPKGTHSAVARMGTDPTDVVAERWWYRTADIHAAYDTRQVFRSDYEHGTHSLLSAWHVDGRYRPQRFTWRAFFASMFKPRAVRRRGKLRVMGALASLDPDEAVRLAARYCRALDSRATVSS